MNISSAHKLLRVLQSQSNSTLDTRSRPVMLPFPDPSSPKQEVCASSCFLSISTVNPICLGCSPSGFHSLTSCLHSAREQHWPPPPSLMHLSQFILDIPRFLNTSYFVSLPVSLSVSTQPGYKLRMGWDSLSIILAQSVYSVNIC